jgi:hypothetical protein
MYKEYVKQYALKKCFTKTKGQQFVCQVQKMQVLCAWGGYS